jgi:hypothetical protein
MRISFVFRKPCPAPLGSCVQGAARPQAVSRPAPLRPSDETLRRPKVTECGFTPADIRHEENGEDARNRWLPPGIASGGGASWP